eukprot:6475662-Amphidinium_carterae.1
MLASSAWQLKYATPFKFADQIMPLETRGVLGAVKHRLKSVSCFGQLFVHLGDNLGLTLGLEKGRVSLFHVESCASDTARNMHTLLHY